MLGGLYFRLVDLTSEQAERRELLQRELLLARRHSACAYRGFLIAA
jgi:hypothetical protein